MRNTSMKKGFTLVELSIVLVIIGLLVGGILVGQSLIDSANLQKAVRSIQQYQAAVLLFKDKFRSLPGDASFFPVAGNNDGRILGWGAQGNGTGNEDMYNGEIGNFWAHMSQSGMLKEQYTGTGTETRLGNNIPIPNNTMPNLDYGDKAQIVGGYSFFEGFDEPLNWDNVFWIIDPPSSPVFINGQGLCGFGLANNDECDYPFSPAQAVAFDQKMDDGAPNNGDVRAAAKGDFGKPLEGSANACVNNLTNTGTYLLSETQDTCALIILMVNR